MKKKGKVLIFILAIMIIVPTVSATNRNIIKKDTLSIIKTIQSSSSSNNSSSLSLNFINASGKGNCTTFGGSAQSSLFSRCIAMIVEFEDDGYTEISTINPMSPLKNLQNILNPDPLLVEGSHEMLIIGFFGKINKDDGNIKIRGIALAFWTNPK